MTAGRPVPVLTAMTDSGAEARLVLALRNPGFGVTVVRRCVDLADLLAVAATGVAEVAVVSGDLRRLDRDAVARLALSGVAVVGVVPAGDQAAERRLELLGAGAVVPADAEPAAIGAAVRAALGRRLPSTGGFAGGGTPGPPTSRVDSGVPTPLDLPSLTPPGRVVAVWGPTGAPGRTSVAIGLAAELAAAGRAPLLVDADVYGGTVAQHLGLLEEAPGLAAACRLANAGTLDVERLASLGRSLPGGLRVLPGISRPARWPELRTAAFEAVLALCREVAPVTVVDCGFSVEQDEELLYDTAAPRRNGATLAALSAADRVLVVGAADPVGIQRLVRGLADLKETLPGVTPMVVLNRLRSVGGGRVAAPGGGRGA